MSSNKYALALDVESTISGGLLIEVGAILYNLTDHTCDEVYSFLIQPYGGQETNDTEFDSVHIHGITKQKTKEEGLDKSAVADFLRQVMQKDLEFTIGHNVHTDISKIFKCVETVDPALAAKWKNLSLRTRYCTMNAAARRIEKANIKLEAAADLIGIKYDELQSHRALDDAILCLAVFTHHHLNRAFDMNLTNTAIKPVPTTVEDTDKISSSVFITLSEKSNEEVLKLAQQLYKKPTVKKWQSECADGHLHLVRTRLREIVPTPPPKRRLSSAEEPTENNKRTRQSDNEVKVEDAKISQDAEISTSQSTESNLVEKDFNEMNQGASDSQITATMVQNESVTSQITETSPIKNCTAETIVESDQYADNAQESNSC